MDTGFNRSYARYYNEDTKNGQTTKGNDSIIEDHQDIYNDHTTQEFQNISKIGRVCKISRDIHQW